MGFFEYLVATSKHIDHLGIAIYFCIYSGVVVAVLMLIISLIVALRMDRKTVLVCGLSIIGSGLRYLFYFYVFFLVNADYRFSHNIDTIIFALSYFGICQIVYGGIEINRYRELDPKYHGGITRYENMAARYELKRFFEETTSPKAGQLMVRMKRENFLVLLLPKSAFCISRDLRSFFVIDKGTYPRWSWPSEDKKAGTIKLVDDAGRRREMIIGEPYLGAFRDWASTVETDEGSLNIPPPPEGWKPEEEVLVACPVCGKGVSTLDESCPSCGCSLKRKGD